MTSTTPSPPRPPRLRLAALPLGLTAVVALLLGTVGYALVGFGVLTSCTNRYSCTETGCSPCRAAGGWLAAGAVGQGVVLLVSVVLLVLAATRPPARRHLAVAGWALLAAAVVWVVVSTTVAGRVS